MAGQMQGEDRLRPTVLVTTARIYAIAAAAIGQIGKYRAAIVRTEEPAPSAIGVRDPERVC